MATATQEYLSAGKLSQLLQRSPAEIHKAAERAGITPALTLNEVRYYSGESMEAIREALPVKSATRGEGGKFLFLCSRPSFAEKLEIFRRIIQGKMGVFKKWDEQASKKRHLS